MVQYAVYGNVIPDSNLGQLSDAMQSIYDSEDPWKTFKEALKSVLLLEPRTVSDISSRFYFTPIDRYTK